jgi:hypothetical protein
MFRSLKVNTAILICSAFIFRLLFANICIVSSSNAQHNKGQKSHYSTLMKRRNHPSDHSKNFGTSVVEICEEDSDEHNQFKANPFFLVQVLYSLAAKGIENHLKLFSRSFPRTLSNQYLVLQVIRI